MRKLLPRQSLKPRNNYKLVLSPTGESIFDALIGRGFAGEPVAVDIETNGLDASDPACRIYGIALSCSAATVYFHMERADDAAWAELRASMCRMTLVAFNVFFDGAFLQREFGPLKWDLDAYALYKQLSLEGWNGQSWSLESAQLDVLGWSHSNKAELDEQLKLQGLSKGEMYKLPPSILGQYCAADADSTWQLTQVLEKAAAPFPRLMAYHRDIFLPQVQLLIEQQARGIYVDQSRLELCRSNLATRIESTMAAFLSHPEVAPHVQQYNEEVVAAWKRAAPPQFTKSGEQSKRYDAWLAKGTRVLEENGFNPNSKDQLRWLFFKQLKYESVVQTETGKPGVGKTALPSLGEPGRLLMDYNIYVKRKQFADKTAERCARDGLIHPQFNSVGTVTTRLGGSGGWNAQQLPKSPDFLACLSARPGHKLIQADIEALEPCILAEFSEDKALLRLYGPGAKPNDIYLFVGAQMPGIGDLIRKYYDPNNPTPEGIEAAKKNGKRERNLAKLTVLRCTYGSSPRGVFESVTLSGIKTTLLECRRLHHAYWQIFRGVKGWESRLHKMWSSSGGWVPSILGTPLCIHEESLKDLVSRHTQASGHLFVQLWIAYIYRLRAARAVEMYPWIKDLHDETIWEAPDAHAEAAAQVVRDALIAAVVELELTIPIRAEPQIVSNMAEIKTKKEYDDMIEAEGDDET